MLTGRRFRVEFTDEQAVFAEQMGAVCRSVWNTGLEQRREYRRRGAWMNYRPQAKELAEAKVEHPWLAPSFRFPEGSKMEVEKLNRRHARVRLPKLGWVKFRLTRSLHSLVIRSATLTREGRHWFLSLLVNDGIEVPTAHPQPDTGVGVDRGVVVAVATSAGELLDRAFVTAGERRRRLDFCQKAAHQLAYANAVVVLEKLPVKNMTRRARPVWDPDSPGGFLPNGAAAKSGLNRAILSKGLVPV
jgi:putative transposase